MRRSNYREYGVSGTSHRAIIDKYLDTLPDDATLLYPGSGGGHEGELLNLACKLVSPGRAKQKRLILADISQTVLDLITAQLPDWPRGCRRVVSRWRILQLDVINGIQPLDDDEKYRGAAAISGMIADESIDLVLALGLFGGLLIERDLKIPAFQSALWEIFRVLRTGGLAIVGNSCERQPAEEFTALSQRAGFQVIECPPPCRTVLPNGDEHPELRYLLVLLKPMKPLC